LSNRGGTSGATPTLGHGPAKIWDCPDFGNGFVK
jgi:hypothetical protein